MLLFCIIFFDGWQDLRSSFSKKKKVIKESLKQNATKQ